MKKNYKLVIMYDGTKYYGWQYLPDNITIQGKLQQVLSDMTAKAVQVNGAGRTDAGVHAQNMIANVFLDTNMSEYEILSFLNENLPDDIRIKNVKIVSDKFHARYKAVGKTYCYTVFAGDNKPVFKRKYVYVLNHKPDIDKMKEAYEYIIGTRDFKCFCGDSKIKKSTVRTVDSIKIIDRDGYIYFYYHGDGFLQNMIRIMTGTLLEVGFGNIKPSDMKHILSSCNRQNSGPTVPANGLCLVKVDYY